MIVQSEVDGLDEEAPRGGAEARVDTMERLDRMTREEVDDLPYGFIVLDTEGVVLLYNRYEERMSRVPVDRVIGRSFFREIAPCTRVEAFLGRFQALAAGPPGATDRFAFRFHFMHGAQDVSVQLTRAPADRVFMTVHRRAAPEAGEGERPEAPRHDADRGQLVGPIGVVLPLGWDQTAALLARAGQTAARELGRSMGRTIVRAAAEAARRAGEPRIELSPVLLAVGALDDAIARAGLGRLAVDLTPSPGIVGCFLRPPVEAGTVELAALYEGLLETALGAVLGATFAARCIDRGDLSAVPWRLALTSIGDADRLEPRAGERPDAVLERLGLAGGESGDRSG